MSKNKDQKRKAQLAARAKNESFRFQVEFTRKQKGIDIMGIEQNLTAELDAICQNDLTDALLDLAKIVEGIQKELGFEQEADKCSLNGTLVPFILGITTIKPDSATYAPSIFTAQQPLQVSIAYDNEQEEYNLQEFHIQPYALKVFNRRWYLLGFIKEKDGLRTIALDRILALKVLTKSFTLPENFDARKYFSNVVGIFVNKDLPVTSVKIRAYGIQAEYLRSPPLHKSQTEGRSKYREFAEFTYRLCITPELISQLLAMGDTVEVLEPQEFREEMKERISKIFNYYK